MAVDFYRTIQLLQVGADHIHPHTAAGKICSLFGGAESGKKNEVKNLSGAQAPQPLRSHKAFFDRFAPDSFGIDPRAIVRDADYDLIALLTSLQLDRAPSPFASLFTHRG